MKFFLVTAEFYHGNFYVACLLPSPLCMVSINTDNMVSISKVPHLTLIFFKRKKHGFLNLTRVLSEKVIPYHLKPSQFCPLVTLYSNWVTKYIA